MSPTNPQRGQQPQWSMENIGIDVHKKESQLCIITEAGEVLGARGKAKVLMEASTESEWVARCLGVDRIVSIS